MIHISVQNFIVILPLTRKIHCGRIGFKSRLTEIFNPIWTGWGAIWPPEGFAKYLKNDLADLHQTLCLLRQLYRSSFKIKSLGIGHSLLPW